MSRLLIRRNQYSAHFRSVLESVHRYLIVWGSRGSGKTNTIILKLLSLTFLQEHIAIVYCRHEKTTLRDTTFIDICNYIKDSPFKEYFDYSTAFNSSMIFTNKLTGHKLVPIGLSDEENTKGLSEITHVWVDEADKCTRSQIIMINSVLRPTARKPKVQLIISFNPNLSWLREFFFDESDEFAPNKIFGDDIFCHHSTVKDNEYIDQEKYIETLSLNYGWNQNLLDINLYGKWGKAEVDKPYINTFDAKKHVDKYEFDNSEILLSFDFNVDPMTCTASQYQKGKVVFVDEYKLNNSWIGELCEYINTRLPKSNRLIITGDATGKNRHANSKGGLNCYDTIQEIMRVGDYDFIIPGQNHSVINSREIVQKAYYRDLIMVSDRCVNLINDLTYCESDMNGKLLKKSTGSGKELSHFMDNMTYAIVNKWQELLNL